MEAGFVPAGASCEHPLNILHQVLVDPENYPLTNLKLTSDEVDSYVEDAGFEIIRRNEHTACNRENVFEHFVLNSSTGKEDILFTKHLIRQSWSYAPRDDDFLGFYHLEYYRLQSEAHEIECSYGTAKSAAVGAMDRVNVRYDTVGDSHAELTIMVPDDLFYLVVPISLDNGYWDARLAKLTDKHWENSEQFKLTSMTPLDSEDLAKSVLLGPGETKTYQLKLPNNSAPLPSDSLVLAIKRTHSSLKDQHKHEISNPNYWALEVRKNCFFVRDLSLK